MFKKKIFIGAIFFSILLNYLYPADDINIKSLKVYLGNDETSYPVITGGKLTIEFDLDFPQEPALCIVFRFCDKNWNPYENLFLRNIGHDVFHYVILDPLPVTVKDAKYHFRGSFPDERDEINFPFSGKYIFYIADVADTSKVYASGKFIVINDVIPIDVTLKPETVPDQIDFPADLARVFHLRIDFDLPEPLYPFYVQDVEILENHKQDFTYTITKDDHSDLKYFNWDANRKFTFGTREIRPGNEYRQLDLRNTNLFSSENVNAQLDGIETSRFYKTGGNDMNGGSVLTKYSDDYANYINVNFRLRPPEELKRRIFLIGAFTNWLLYPENELINEEGLYSLATRIKRGKYDYQYVAADLDRDGFYNIDWYVLEGNNWTTSNNYYVFVYYSEQEKGGYDRIIGYQKVVSK